jgi:hypothetical protein
MRPTTRLLAIAASSGNGFKPAPMAILPPIPLYRRLLRAHRRHLPTEMRLLGDEYVKAEFRAHRNVDNPAHLVRCSIVLYSVLALFFTSPKRHYICVCSLRFFVADAIPSPLLQIGFLTEWQLYAQKVEGDSWKGEKLDPAKVEKMSGMPFFSLLSLSPVLSYVVLWRLYNNEKLTDRTSIDQQIGQMYELMMAIKKSREEGEGQE